MRESMLVVVSVTGNADVLLVLREELLCEKNNGEVGAPSRFWERDNGAVAAGGMFSWRVGEEPVRAFFAEPAGFIVPEVELLRLSSLLACLDDDRFADFVRAGPDSLVEGPFAGVEIPEGLKGGGGGITAASAEDPCRGWCNCLEDEAYAGHAVVLFAW